MRSVATTAGLYAVCWAALAFGNSLQPIAALTWAAPFLLLLTYEWTLRSLRSQLLGHVLIIALQTAGTTFGMAGMLSWPTTTVASFCATVGFGAALATATTLGALLPAAALRHKATALLPPLTPAAAAARPQAAAAAPPRPLLGRAVLVAPLWAFPVMQGGVRTLVGLVLGHDHDPGVALADWAALAQLAALFGLWGLNFLPDLVASAAYTVATAEHLPLERLPDAAGGAGSDGGGGGGEYGAYDSVGGGGGGYDSDDADLLARLLGASGSAAAASGGGGGGGPSRWSRLSRPLRRHVAAAVAAVAVLCVVGGGLVHGDAFYQRAVTERLARERRLAASCVVGQSVRVGSEDYLWLWQKTAERVAAGDHFVLWAEEAVDVMDDGEEAALLEAGRKLLEAQQQQLSGSSGPASGAGSYLGLAYQKFGGRLPRGRSTNHFVLLAPNGSTVWDYLKAFPVPVVEAHVMAGPAKLPVADSPYGRLSGAICFDLDRPLYIRQAGAAGVDLLLQPSWTWGAVGPRHFQANVLRAVENGLTILRCSSSGVSGAVSPRGAALHYLLTGERDLLTFQLPLQRRTRTLYVSIGWLAEVVNLLLAAALWAAAATPTSYLAPWVQPRRGDGVAAGGGGRHYGADAGAAEAGRGSGGGGGGGASAGTGGAVRGVAAGEAQGSPAARQWWARVRSALVSAPLPGGGGSGGGSPGGGSSGGAGSGGGGRGREPLLGPSAGGRGGGAGRSYND